MQSPLWSDGFGNSGPAAHLELPVNITISELALYQWLETTFLKRFYNVKLR